MLYLYALPPRPPPPGTPATNRHDSRSPIQHPVPPHVSHPGIRAFHLETRSACPLPSPPPASQLSRSLEHSCAPLPSSPTTPALDITSPEASLTQPPIVSSGHREKKRNERRSKAQGKTGEITQAAGSDGAEEGWRWEEGRGWERRGGGGSQVCSIGVHVPPPCPNRPTAYPPPHPAAASIALAPLDSPPLPSSVPPSLSLSLSHKHTDTYTLKLTDTHTHTHTHTHTQPRARKRAPSWSTPQTARDGFCRASDHYLP